MNRVRRYAIRWGLSGLKQIDYKSVTMNRLFICISAKHGACVLKIGYRDNDIKNEYNILHEYNGTRFCKVCEVDIENGVLLLERIVPGMQLREVTDLDKRLELFWEVFNELHIQPTDKTVYPTYMEWVSRISGYMRDRVEYETLAHKMVRAEQICHELWEKYSSEMLLHGDLHHDNILLGEDNYYHIIDPKGVIGDRVFDIPRFILNEFDDVLDHDFDEKFKHIVRTFSTKLNIPELDIRRLVYVEMCMGQCWHVEDGKEPNMSHVYFVEKTISERMRMN